MREIIILIGIYLFSVVLAAVGIYMLVRKPKPKKQETHKAKAKQTKVVKDDSPMLVSIEDMLPGYGKEEEEKR